MNKTVNYLVQSAFIAAIYTALVLLWPLSSSAVQVRLAEALTVLPYFTPAAIPGVTLGCLLGNLFTGAALPDIIFGSLATLLGTIGSYLLRSKKWLVPLPPILANILIIPWVLRFSYGLDDAVPYLMLTIGIGEVISCGILGLLLLKTLEKHRAIFHFTKK